jgi:hypothetical protein
MKNVYVALAEVKPLPECEICPASAEGGFARCYALAANAGAAEQAVRAKLAAERLELVELSWCVSYEDAEWENPESEDAARCAREARTTGEVVLGRLDFWVEDDA